MGSAGVRGSPEDPSLPIRRHRGSSLPVYFCLIGMATFGAAFRCLGRLRHSVGTQHEAVARCCRVGHLGGTWAVAAADAARGLGSPRLGTAPEMSGQEVAAVLSGYAKLWNEHAQSQLKLLRSGHDEVASTMFLALMEDIGKTLLKALDVRTVMVAPTMSASDVANALTALALLSELPDEPLMLALGQRVQAVVNDLSAQDVAKTSSAYARLKAARGGESLVRL